MPLDASRIDYVMDWASWRFSEETDNVELYGLFMGCIGSSRGNNWKDNDKFTFWSPEFQKCGSFGRAIQTITSKGPTMKEILMPGS